MRILSWFLMLSLSAHVSWWFLVCGPPDSFPQPCALFLYTTHTACQDWEGGAGNFPNNPDLADPIDDPGFADITGDTGEYGGGCGTIDLIPHQQSSFIEYGVGNAQAYTSGAFKHSFSTPAKCEAARKAFAPNKSRGCITEGPNTN